MSRKEEKWFPTGRYVSPIDFDAAGWLPVSMAEAMQIEEWEGDLVYTSKVQRAFWARREDALAARAVVAVISESDC